MGGRFLVCIWLQKTFNFFSLYIQDDFFFLKLDLAKLRFIRWILNSKRKSAACNCCVAIKHFPLTLQRRRQAAKNPSLSGLQS